MQAHQVHEAVHDVGCSGHVAHVLQETQGGKEDGQDGKEGDHRACAADDAFYQPDRIKYSQIESFVYGIRSQAPNGILGDARGAQAEAGRRLLEIRIKQAAEEVRRMIAVAQEGTE